MFGRVKPDNILLACDQGNFNQITARSRSGERHVHYHCATTVTLIAAPCCYLIKVTSFALRVVQFDSAKHRRFSLGTPVSSCSNTGPVSDCPYWTSRGNSLAS